MGEIKLKALDCLWCHSGDIAHERTSRTRSQMVCADCGAAGPAVFGEKPIDGDDPTAAITAWNTRTPLEVDEGADALNWLAGQKNLQLTWGDADEAAEGDPCVWRIHAVNGGRNDREWTEIATGYSPLAAIKAALAAFGGEE